MQSLIPSLPHSWELSTNTTPQIGVVAFFDYPHYGIIVDLDATGFWMKDSNWGGPGYRTHYVPWTNPHLRGFWKP